MITPDRVFAATLASGLARRFGSDKLAAPFGDGTVLDAALAPLDHFDWLGRSVILQARQADGWQGPGRAIVNGAPERGMGHSLALAARTALEADAAFLLVTLGDMPLIATDTIAALLAACPDRADALAALVAPGHPPGPPALFGQRWLRQLAEAGGDSGARDILRDTANGLVTVDCPAEQALDIDVPGDLARSRVQRR